MKYTDDPQMQTMIDNMPEKTGKSLEEWFSIIKSSGLVKHGEIMKLLKGEHGVTHGFANSITLIYRQQASGGPAGDDDLITGQYAKKLGMKPWYDQLITEVSKFGKDVEIAPKKSYVSLRRAKQFGIIQPSTKTRMDIGLNLKGVETSGVLIEGDKWGGMCSHRIEIHSPEEITPEVIDWLHKAYQSGK
jgi:predicted transport protein